MDEESKSSSQEISKDLFGSKLELKKILKTFLQIFRNIKVVMDDYNQNGNNYTRPVKYALTVIAPYVVIMQLFDFDMVTPMMEISQQSNQAQLAANPEMASFFDNYYRIAGRIFEIQYEFLPAVYAIIYLPVLAFWLRVFFKRKNLNFSFYYALGTYTMMSLVALTLPFNTIGLAGILDMNLTMSLSVIIGIAFFFYVVIKVFQEGIFESIIKTILVYFFMFITVVIPMFIAITVLAIVNLS